MATIVKNVKKFSKIYVVNSDFSTTNKNLLYSINLGAPEIKYAYLGNDLIYDAEGSGYYLAAYLMSYDNPSTEKIYQPNGEAAGAYIVLHSDSYTVNTTFGDPSSNAWYSYNWTTGEKFRAYITSYYRNNSGSTTNIITDSGAVRLQYPKLTYLKNSSEITYTNIGIQHTLISSNDSVGVNFTNINTYTYQYYYSNKNLLANQKIWFNFFVPRQSYITTSLIEANYDNLKKTSNNANTINLKVYYNVGTDCDFRAVSNLAKYRKEKYLYQFLDGLDTYLFNEPITPSTNTEYFSYIYQVKDRLLDRAQWTTSGANATAYAENTRCNFKFNGIHTNYNGDTYYYYGVNKNFSRRITCYFNSYQQLNSYTTTLVSPAIHDNFVGTININMAPYILLYISISIDSGVTSGNTNWEDIAANILFNPVGENGVYSLKSKNNWSSVNNSGLNQSWESFIDSNSGDSMRNPEYRGRSFPTYDWYPHEKYINDVKISYNLWKIRQSYQSFSHPIENIPYSHHFPDDISMADIKSKSRYTEYDEFEESDDNYFYYLSQSKLTDCTNNRSEFKNDGTDYIYVIQNTPDIDGQNGYTQDYVLNGQKYLLYTNYDSNGNPVGNGIEDILNSSAKPYTYDTHTFYCMVPWTYHDKDINIIIINRNLNYTPSDIEYKAYIKNYTESSWHTCDTLGSEVYNSGDGVKGQCFKYVHNLKVDHSNTRGIIDYWNHIYVAVWQNATGDYRS